MLSQPIQPGCNHGPAVCLRGDNYRSMESARLRLQLACGITGQEVLE